MKHALALALVFLLVACAAKPAAVGLDLDRGPVWRYRVRTGTDGKRHAFAANIYNAAEVPLPDGLWCPHGSVVQLVWNASGEAVGAASVAEPLHVTRWPHDELYVHGDGMRTGVRIKGREASPAFAIAPAEDQKQPFVVLRWKVDEHQTNWAVFDHRADDLRMTEMGPWQIEHLQFQRMERPGPGLENCVLLTFQAGEGSQHAVVKVEVGDKGARLRPRTDEDAAILRHFLGRATPAEKAVVEKILTP